MYLKPSTFFVFEYYIEHVCNELDVHAINEKFQQICNCFMSKLY